MSTEALAPLPVALCLRRSYKSRGVKGGTIIAEGILDVETHRERLLDPDDYRKAIGHCRACGSERLHAHAFRQRKLRPARKQDGPTLQEETIRLYCCAVKNCRAVFTVLPAFIARHLWRAWSAVEAVASGRAQAAKTTARRWLGRLAADASQLAQTFCALGACALSAEAVVAARAGGTRADLVRRLAPADAVTGEHPFACVAAWIHRLVPGLRLM